MKKILCFGDSNVYGFNPNTMGRYDENSRWTSILAKNLGDNFEILEAGGNNRTGFVDNVDGNNNTGYKILPKLLEHDFDYVILAIGINDTQTQYDFSLEDIKNGLSTMISLVKNKLPNAKIIVISPSKIGESILKHKFFSTIFDITSIEKSNQIPKIYQEVAKEFEVNFVDLNQIVTPSIIDGLHYEIKEHKKLAKCLQNLIFEI